MQCARCGLTISAGSIFCPRCGQRVATASGSGGPEPIAPSEQPPDDSAVTLAGESPTFFDPGAPVTSARLQAGSAFGTRYRILQRLGEGGMGIVYKAWDDQLSIPVALKLIRPEAMTDPVAALQMERRFKRELVLARQVTHKNVVRIHDLGELGTFKYFTMPFIEGQDLGAVIAREGKLPVARGLRIARQVAAGLSAAHELGIVHRDLKPENVMLDADDTAVIMDFGLARTNDGANLTMTGAVMGTLGYMAPEQARGEAIDQRVDIYAWGLLCYDMLAGLFGAFVDIGVHQNGLVHVLQLAHRFVKDPREVVKAGDIVKVKVVEFDVKRKRIALTIKLDEVTPAGRSKPSEGRQRRADVASQARASRTRKACTSCPPATSLAAAFAKLSGTVRDNLRDKPPTTPMRRYRHRNGAICKR